MPTQFSQLSRLEALFKLANESYVKPEDLKQLLDAFVSVIKDMKDRLAVSIADGDAVLDKKVSEYNKSVLKEIRSVERKVETMFVDYERLDKKNDGDMYKRLSDEIQSVKKLIPVVPKVPDLSLIERKIAKHESAIASLLDGKEKSDSNEELMNELIDHRKKIRMLEEKKHYAEGLLGKSLSNLVDVNVAGIVSGQTIQWNGQIWVAANGGTPVSATGSVDGVNASFVFSVKPGIIFSDGAAYRENHGWTWSDSTATLAVAPAYDIFGI